MLQPGSPAEHGGSARGAGTEPHPCLVNFQASAPTARDAPRGCHVARLGRVWGSRRVSPGNPWVFLDLEELLLLPTPSAPFVLPLLPCV